MTDFEYDFENMRSVGRPNVWDMEPNSEHE